MIVSIGAPEPGMSRHFDTLAQRAGANVFMHPAALTAADALGFARIHVLQAWRNDRLVGFWALRERRLALRPAFLAAPPYDYSFVSTPVIDPDHVEVVIAAFLDAIAREPALPNVIQFKFLDGDCPSFGALMQALRARKARMLTLAERARPFLGAASERKRSGSTGKKLRQDWNRLGALGAVEIVNARAPAEVRDAFEQFLTLEAQSWKGAAGTALLCEDEDAAFTRRLIGDLAARGAASVALLRVDNRAIAAQVLLYSGAMAYTWKTAFDAAFAKFSPGALLVDKVTDELFACGIAQIESCSTEGGFMSQLWSGQRMTVDLLVDVGAERSLSFALAALAERAYAWLRAQRNQLRAANLLPPAKKGMVTRG